MSDTTYIDYVQPAVSAEWLNEINDHVWHDTPVAGTTVHNADNIKVIPFDDISSTTVQTALEEINTYLSVGTGAVETTVQNKLREFISVKDFGAVGDGVTDDTAAIQSAYDFLVSQGGGTLRLPSGIYKCNSSIIFTGTDTDQNSAKIFIRGDGNLSTILDFSTSTVGSDGVQITGAGRINLQGFTVKDAKNYGINVNAGQNPGDATYVSRFTLRDIVVTGSTSHGIRLANAYMGLLENIESRNNGGDGFHFAGNHTSITVIRCWGGGDGVYPDGGNSGIGWFINGMIYSKFIGCAADWNTGSGYKIYNCNSVSFDNCGSESNGGEGFFVESSTQFSTGSPVTGINAVSFNGCLGYNNSKSGINKYANLLGAVTADSTPASIAINNCADILAGGQTTSLVLNGTSGTITLFDKSNKLSGSYVHTGTVVVGNYLTASASTAAASSLTNGIANNAGNPAITLTLSAGDWDVWGTAVFVAAATTSITNITAGISTASATFGAVTSFISQRGAAYVPAGNVQLNTPIVRVRSTGSTIVYMPVIATFSVSTLGAAGAIFAKKAE